MRVKNISEPNVNNAEGIDLEILNLQQQLEIFKIGALVTEADSVSKIGGFVMTATEMDL